jgi:hypothetical protein
MAFAKASDWPGASIKIDKGNECWQAQLLAERSPRRLEAAPGPGDQEPDPRRGQGRPPLLPLGRAQAHNRQRDDEARSPPGLRAVPATGPQSATALRPPRGRRREPLSPHGPRHDLPEDVLRVAQGQGQVQALQILMHGLQWRALDR